jgi:hypothetical protein
VHPSGVAYLPDLSPLCYLMPMSRDTPDDERTVSCTTDHDPSTTRWVPWRDDYMPPDPCRGIFDADWLPGTVELELTVGEDQVHCAAITVRAREDEPLTARGLRNIPLGAFIRLATALTLAPIETDNTGRRVINMTAPYAPSDVSAPRARRHISEACLQEVATIYMRAIEEEEPPTRAVEHRHSLAPISYQTAARWVRLARDADLLPPAERAQRSR